MGLLKSAVILLGTSLSLLILQVQGSQPFEMQEMQKGLEQCSLSPSDPESPEMNMKAQRNKLGPCQGRIWAIEPPIPPETECNYHTEWRIENARKEKEEFEHKLPLQVKTYTNKNRLRLKQYKMRDVEHIDFGDHYGKWRREFGPHRWAKMLHNYRQEVLKSPQFKFHQNFLINYGNKDVALALCHDDPEYHYHAVNHLYRKIGESQKNQND